MCGLRRLPAQPDVRSRVLSWEHRPSACEPWADGGEEGSDPQAGCRTWGDSLTPLSLSFLCCKMGTIMILPEVAVTTA